MARNPDAGMVNDHTFISASEIEFEECRLQLEHPIPAEASRLRPDTIELLNWNIKKGQMTNWDEDLSRLAGNKDLILIQEATTSMEISSGETTSLFRTFAAGYTTSSYTSGVATYSKAAPVGHCKLTSVEPWLGTPKVANFTRYALDDSSRSLLVVNIHMMNFAFGSKHFEEQIEKSVSLLSRHEGPLIISGDFNTWRPARRKLLEEKMTFLNLQPVYFEEDNRVKFFGQKIDHIYVGKLEVNGATTFDVTSSDHNPMTVSLSVLPQ
jgi:endonuclease/exonuclease/phosphatase (EEP) superfamily protein YafD